MNLDERQALWVSKLNLDDLMLQLDDVLGLPLGRKVILDPDDLKYFSHRYTLAENGEEQLSLMESCQGLCASAYICARNALVEPPVLPSRAEAIAEVLHLSCTECYQETSWGKPPVMRVVFISGFIAKGETKKTIGATRRRCSLTFYSALRLRAIHDTSYDTR
jgi:hypothetical protein